MDIDKTFSVFANRIAKVTGSPWTFGLCVLLVLVWAASGPIFKFSETWQLVINTSTTIITFLMVFLIQNTQNRDGEAVQAKLDDLIVTSAAENEFAGIEKLSDKELRALHDSCLARAKAHQTAHARVKLEMGRRGKSASAQNPSRRPRKVSKASPANSN